MSERDKSELSELRKEYASRILSEADILMDPIEQFKSWFADASLVEETEPNAMALATADADGRVSNRMVLLKGIENGEFRFFTNYQSKKGKQIDENAHAALLFWWPGLERQVRIEGSLQPLSPEASDSYFKSRPVGSQVGAIASPQSQVISSRSEMEDKFAAEWEKYQEKSVINRPVHWGGYGLKPILMEFWQGRPNRLHDRIQFTLSKEYEWEMNRLAP